MKSYYWADVLHAYAKGNLDYEGLTDFFCEKVVLKKEAAGS